MCGGMGLASSLISALRIRLLMRSYLYLGYLLAAREEANRVRAWSDELKPPRDPAAEGAADEDE